MNSICPYPGLRPFNEKESIYFKGREEHIEKIINQLQEKHFIMVTGASGDGKSSLIYAGLIPRARAGFFKAKFNNWIIADFKPERNPLKNLSTSLNNHLDLPDPKLTYDELSYGFSSLVEVYKSSPYFLDYDSEEYKNADFEQKLNLKNKAANLLILIDQFEELFTNTENFPTGKASEQVIALNNLIVNTTKICKEENIPIYIVCTMRSDYVGDCASLKNLPELIVYSQFFVPRLKRHEIHRAILEPAKLSDNKISNRLVERLINDLNDGQDQLPILQHALNRIWKISHDDNADEMDLIHYAKGGGISYQKLDEADRFIFSNWIDKEPSYKKEILEHASLGNVLNSHARELYWLTPNNFKKLLPDLKLSDEEIFSLLKKVFLSLTKINDNRAVRNRVGVNEILGSLKNECDLSILKALIHFYNHTSNSLLLPFHDSNEKLQDLSVSSTLDITHESLIRNWKDLMTWTVEENENMNILEDFRKQTIFWKESGKDKKYLLAEGPLNYFENWFKEFNPSSFSIVKYDSRTLSYEQKLSEAEDLLINLTQFLRASKDAISKRKRFAYISLSTIILILSLFTVWAILERNKAIEQTEIADQKTLEAKKSQENALQQREEAEKAKAEALANESLALISKEEAKKAQILAEKAEKSALDNLRTAKKNAELARNEAARANTALNESEKSKQEAFKEKQNAEKQEKKATELSYLATAQNLAIKSGFRTNDPELQSLMALQSYYFNKDNSGDIQDPIIFEALNNAKKNYLKDEIVLNVTSEQRAMKISQNGKELLSSDRMGTFYKFDISENNSLVKKQMGRLEENEFNLIESSSNKSISVSPKGLLSHWDLSEISKPKLLKTVTAHSGVVREIVVVLETNPLIISAGKDSTITILNYEDFKVRHTIKINFFVKDIEVDVNLKAAIILTENGKLHKLNYETGEILSLDNSIDLNGKISCIKINSKKSEFIAGFEDGKLKVMSLSNVLKNVFTAKLVLNEFKSTIEIIELNLSNSKMAVSASDKSLKYFDVNKNYAKPIQLKNNSAKVRSIAFTNEDNLWVSYSDRTIRYYEISAENIAKNLCQALKRNFTEKEWLEIVSSELPYEKTCK